MSYSLYHEIYNNVFLSNPDYLKAESVLGIELFLKMPKLFGLLVKNTLIMAVELDSLLAY
ncbi:hypothetical protein [Aeromonas caviae]|uniref:Uncharacterized protein n=1 Tax=Aeromonas caviae TaxID=648 RepID=A0AA37FW18_AERCA|nr:hypothetical protein [Aeromonas caviae]GJA05274.1 hypothetical protein KAM333_07020 [Aeromonas caviae]GJA14913.1 hypothetical protein KAM335_21090 [Aeromonas caviae]GJA17640.1 hypothetical protein KAM336_06610 [Aeromonas caviae]GJA23551.1 hypothetical protein KAM337_20790 [Aeromonas caviae]GJA26598.1 hypothetical protein KAM340_07650 [Aeromonas caviae]